MRPSFRNNGTIGALLDEYEKALSELKTVTQNISDEDLVAILDKTTSDEDCKSVQSILTHVIQSGYTYIVEIRKSLGESIGYRDKVMYTNINAYHDAIDKMFAFNEELFADYPNIQLLAYDADKKFITRWGQLFDVEQLFNHAIVHTLKHRRQIEKLTSLKNP